MENKNASALIAYYGKFNEDKRLQTRHGRVEYEVTMYHIRKWIRERRANGAKEELHLADIGAGTGRYTIALAEEYPGMQITAVELVNHNLGRLKQKVKEADLTNVRCLKQDAMDLKKIPDASCDITLLFGPLYHLKTEEERVAALREAGRITKSGGLILAAYVMNEYALLIHGFRDHNIIEDGRRVDSVDDTYHVLESGDALYSFIRMEDADRLNELAGLKRIDCFSPDGPANHMRQELNRLSEEEFREFIRYQICVSGRRDLIGAGGHMVDVLTK